MTQIKTFKELVRRPTGTHFLDSGMENGRYWQQPALYSGGHMKFRHRIDLEVYKFGEYWGYQCTCGILVGRFDKHPKVS